VIAALSVDSSFHSKTTVGLLPRASSFTVWKSGVTLGYTWTIRDAVSFHVAAGLAENLLRGDAVAIWGPSNEGTFMIGSVQSVGYRALPLVQVHVRDNLSIDAHASLKVGLKSRELRDNYLIGVTWNF
jgi:hypothetical protein